MLEWPKIINKTLSVKLSLMVVFELTLLLFVALGVMFFFARKMLKNEAMRNAEQTLEATVQHIDNILLSIEQSTGNVYWDILGKLKDQERMYDYCETIVESNPYIVGCAIALEPSFNDDHQPFMAYVHREGYRDDNDMMVKAEAFGSQLYTEQEWYQEPLREGHACWADPLKEVPNAEAVTCFSLPLFDQTWKPVGVLSVDLSIALLSSIVLDAKPSENGYCTLLGEKGSFIVHPDPVKLAQETVFTQCENGAAPSVREAAEAMVNGERGYKPFVMDGRDWYVFYRPFKRSAVPGRAMEELKWSVGVVYPEDDIFGGYNLLLTIVLGIAIFGMLLALVLCTYITHRQLEPLHLLTESAKRITNGNYDEDIPDSRRKDEIGQLQFHVKEMQKALAARMSDLQKSTDALQERNEVLKQAYIQTQEADRVKTAFLHHMTNQMTSPADTIVKSVTELCNHYHDYTSQEATDEVDIIQSESQVITQLLDNLIEAAEGSTRKEDGV
ncbi:MAG: HAMP domain-containing protein [Prevotella sp.]|nr:HAMP domain-containing protein [Prevotella sp.]